MGKLIVIEGTDSSGKETQSKILFDTLKKLNKKVIKISFPDYDSPACAPVKMYLSGELGEDANLINPYPISTMYAIDRYVSYVKKWKNLYLDDYIVITDRYVTSNMIHQASKIDDTVSKERYLNWLDDLEYEKNKLPRPDKIFFLKMPIEKAKILMQERKNKITGESKKDIHEKDIDYLKKSYLNACEISKKYSWTEINCIDGDRIKTIDEISQEIYREIEKMI